MSFSTCFPQAYSLEIAEPGTADVCWQIIRDRQVVGQYSLWWRKTPKVDKKIVGYIGSCSAQNQTDFLTLLQEGAQQLQAEGCQMVIAPIDGNTWQKYRVVTESGDEARFFLESPYSNIALNIFQKAGFKSVATYHSRLVTDLTQQNRRSPRIKKRLDKQGVTIRTLDIQNLRHELSQIYQIIRISFQQNFLYSPITKDQFIKQYETLVPCIDPKFILIAERHGKIVGFMFAIPDWYERQQSIFNRTIIFKTLAVLPDRCYAGLGQLLVDQCLAIAQESGFQRAIFALIRDVSICENLTHTYGKVMRRYGLFGKTL